MSALALPMVGYYSCAPDRSLSPVGAELRERLEVATVSPTPLAARDTVVFERLMSAINDALDGDTTFSAPLTLSRTLDLLRTLPVEMPLPGIVVESENKIGLDWDESPARVISLTVDDSPRVGYSSVIGQDSHYGRVEFVEGARHLPRTLHQLLLQIYPSDR